jgi:hypothetical protein
MATAKHKNFVLRQGKAALGVGELGAGILLLSVFIISVIWLSVQRQPHTVSSPDLYAGSIVFFSAENTKCRRFTFNNITGSIKDEGQGDCEIQDVGRTRILSEIANSFRGK